MAADPGHQAHCIERGKQGGGAVALTITVIVPAYSDDAGRLFQSEAGQVFRSHAGHGSDLKPDSLCAFGSCGFLT